MSINDMLLTCLAVDTLTDDRNKEKKESYFLHTIMLFLVVGGGVYYILYRIGVPLEQLQNTAMILVTPFIWDYLINSNVMDLSNFQHILAAVGSMIVAILMMVAFDYIADLSKYCGKLKYKLVQSIGFALHMLSAGLKALAFAVFMFSLLKGGFHMIVGLFLWLF